MSAGLIGNSCQFLSRSSLSPWNRPASISTFAWPVSSRYLEPVTVRAAPRNVIEGIPVSIIVGDRSTALDATPSRQPSFGPPGDRGGTPPAARGARSRGEHGRLDRYVPRGTQPHPRRHVRLPHRQRGRLEGRRQ